MYFVMRTRIGIKVPDVQGAAGKLSYSPGHGLAAGLGPAAVAAVFLAHQLRLFAKAFAVLEDVGAVHFAVGSRLLLHAAGRVLGGGREAKGDEGRCRCQGAKEIYTCKKGPAPPCTAGAGHWVGVRLLTAGRGLRRFLDEQVWQSRARLGDEVGLGAGGPIYPTP